MPFKDNEDLERLETRLTRLGQARDKMDMLLYRLGRISNRAPYLEDMVDRACRDAAEANALITDEFEEAKRERNSKKPPDAR